MGLTSNLGKLSNMITSTGSAVGIGTSSPSQILTVVGSDNTQNAIASFAANNLTQQVEVWYGGIKMGGTSSGADLNLAAKGNGNMLFSTNSSERMRITSTGLVGIGTSSPTANLQLSGFTSGLPASSGSAQRGGFRIANSSNIAFDFGTVAAGQAWIQVSDVNNYASNFALLLNPNGGNIGIGTSTPNFTTTNRTVLDINGTSTSLLSFSSGGSGKGYIYNDGTNLSINSQTGNISFSNSTSELVRITNAGNVGIGTSSPSAKLHTEVSSSGWVAKIINTNTSTDNAGLLIKAGVNSGNEIILAQKANGTSAFLVDASGAVTTPLQPSFRAYYSVNGFWNLNTSDVFIFDLTEYNIGGCYNTSNGRFTAPVAGVYQFNFYTIVWGAVTNGGISFRKNGGFPASGYNVHFSPNLSGAWSNVVYTTSIYLNANDYVNVLNIGPYTQFHGKDWSSFSGYLVG